MKAQFHVDASDNVVALCFFDPGALPQDIDALLRVNPTAAVEGLANAKRMWKEELEQAGGCYLLHIHSGKLPAELCAHITFQKSGELMLPNGDLCFSKMEVTSSNSLLDGRLSFLAGEKIFNLPVGSYQVTMAKIEWPGEMMEQRMEAATDELNRRLRISSKFFQLYVIAGVSLLLYCWMHDSVVDWKWVAIFAWVVPIWWGNLQTPVQQALEKRLNDIEDEFPDIVLGMERKVS